AKIFFHYVSCNSEKRRARRESSAVGVPMITLASDEVCVTLTLTSVMQRCCVLVSHNLNLIAIIAQHTRTHRYRHHCVYHAPTVHACTPTPTHYTPGERTHANNSRFCLVEGSRWARNLSPFDDRGSTQRSPHDDRSVCTDLH
ncbi:unnamed protein product, partial [Ectocarpus sp. 8 AP-2014]